jgi:hypothetical protein
MGHLRLRYCKFITHFIISIAVLENVPPDAGLQKRATFSTLNVGLAETRNQTQATCVAGTVARRSAIHYASLPPTLFIKRKSRLSVSFFLFQCLFSYLESLRALATHLPGKLLLLFCTLELSMIQGENCRCVPNGQKVRLENCV